MSEYYSLPMNGVHVPYAHVMRRPVGANYVGARIEETLFPALSTNESGMAREFKVRVFGVPSIAVARRVLRENGYPGEVTTSVRGYLYGVTWPDYMAVRRPMEFGAELLGGVAHSNRDDMSVSASLLDSTFVYPRGHESVAKQVRENARDLIERHIRPGWLRKYPEWRVTVRPDPVERGVWYWTAYEWKPVR